jgi:hypothetical protein
MNELLMNFTAWDIANSLKVIATLLLVLAVLAYFWVPASSVALMLWLTRTGVVVTGLLLRAWYCRRDKRKAVGYLRRAVFAVMRDYWIS